MFTIERRGFFRRRNRLIAQAALTEQDFREVAARLGQPIIRARKIGFVAARKAQERETVVTRWNGQETRNTAEPGDWVVTNLSADKKVLRDKDGNTNTYVIRASKFPSLYEPLTDGTAFGALFKARGQVEAIYLSGGFDIQAPWGQKQTSRVGYLLLNAGEVYGNHKDTFEATYEVIKR
ncbi:MAG TPA: hypothetical protein VNK52_02060 [Hyphomicrobiaceae bacterium]|nr:hypothetical protein [Hyphomicrobiaceae bacterium]